MTREEAIKIVRNIYQTDAEKEALATLIPELRESEDERIKKTIRQLLETARDAHSNTSLAKPFIDALAWLEKQKESLHIPETCKENADSFTDIKDRNIRGCIGMALADISESRFKMYGVTLKECLAWLEKQKEKPKTADSIPSDCTSDAKCEDRWHKVGDSLPDNGRLVLANDCLGNTLLARYDGEGNWEVSVYDNEDYYCRNTITKWCEIPSEKQKEQKRPTLDDPDLYGDWDNDLLEEIHSWLGHLDGKYTPYTIDDIKLTARHFVEWQKQKEQKPADLSDMMVHKEPYIAPVPTPMVADEQKPAEYIPDSVKFSEGYKTGREVGFREGVESVKPINHNLTTWHRDVAYCAMCDKNLDEGLRCNLEIVYKTIKEIVDRTPVVVEQKPTECEDCAMYLSGKCIHPNGKCENVKSKQEWSEEDEDMIRDIIASIDTKIPASDFQEMENWLKFLPERFNLQSKPEWSEMDEDILNCCISSIEEAKENRYAYKETDGDTSYDREIAWLKSLRPQYHGDVTMTEAYKMGKEAGEASRWKPSEEQIHAIIEALKYLPNNKDEWMVLNTLVDVFKKLI